MDLQIASELKEGILVVTASGSIASDEALRLLKQVFDTAKEKEVNKILVNGLAMDGELQTFDRYRIAGELTAYLREHGQSNVRLAFVGRPPTIGGLGVLVAQNRGVTTEWFSSHQEALYWLEKWPS